MRRSVVFLAPLTLGLLALFACEDSSVGGGGSFNLDAGDVDVLVPTPTPVADAAASDAGADADAASPTTVTVAVLGSAAARAGVEVFFSDATGALLESKTTAADGTATSTGATAPAMATALLKNSGRYSIVTWAAVSGGDVLSIRAIEPGDEAKIGTYAITTSGLVAPDYQTYEASSLCTTSPEIGSDVTLDVYPECLFGATTSVLAHVTQQLTQGNTNAEVYAFQKNVAAPGAATPLALTGFLPPVKATITVANPPGDTTIQTSLMEISGGAPFHQQGGNYDEVTAKATYDVANGFADAIQTAVVVDPYNSSHNDLVVRVTGSTSIAADVGSPLPDIAGLAISGDPQHPTFTWTGDTTATSGGAVQANYFGPQEANFTWTILVPAGATTVTAPSLPTDAVETFLGANLALTDYRDPTAAFVAGPGLTAATLRAGAFASIEIGFNRLEDLFTSTPMRTDGTYKMSVYSRQLPP